MNARESRGEDGEDSVRLSLADMLQERGSHQGYYHIAGVSMDGSTIEAEQLDWARRHDLFFTRYEYCIWERKIPKGRFFDGVQDRYHERFGASMIIMHDNN
jgi:hypothetical protein